MLLPYHRVIRAGFLFWVLATADGGLVRRSAERCSGDAVVKALQDNGSGGVAYCKSLAGREVTVTEMAVRAKKSFDVKWWVRLANRGWHNRQRR